VFCLQVPNCDTLHALIREHRDAHKVPLNLEHRLMLAMAPDYDHLPLVNKVSEQARFGILFLHRSSIGKFPKFANFEERRGK
jgi:phosphatidylinositol kinase/protein kinase (PI-3  family)